MSTQRITGAGVQAILNGETRTFRTTGTDRSQFIITNLETPGATTKVLYVAGSNLNVALAVFPFSALTLETNAEFTLVNSSGNTINYLICEVFGGFVATGRSTPRS